MRIMIAVVVILVGSVLSIVMMAPSGTGQTGNGAKIEASINEPVQQ
ncbi:hypothetical protein AB4Z25_17980 [Rhizobium sp. RAF36]|jgi:hypothetical protein